jgi:hypothetical protein
MSSGPEGEKRPSRQGRINDGICSDSCIIQEPLDVAGGSIYDNALTRAAPNRSRPIIRRLEGHDPQFCHRFIR